MDNAAFECLVIFAIICVNSLFVISEISIITSRKSKLIKLDKENRIGATYALKLKDQPENFLSTVQIAITLMSILIGFYSGANITNNVVNLIEDIPFLTPYAHKIADFIVVFSITFLTVLGEIVPKRIAMLHPEKFSLVISIMMYYCMKLFLPVVGLLTFTTKWFLKIFNISQNKNEFSVEELKTIISQAEDEGTVDKSEKDMIRRVIHLSDMKVGAIMTPRNQIVALDLHHSDEENISKLTKYPYNYFPVIEGTFDNLVGLVTVKDLFNTKITNQTLSIKSKLMPIIYIPELARLTQLLELFKEKHIRVAIVLDEYGEVDGIVTFNDLLKTFIGDIATQNVGQFPSVVQRKDNSYIVSANLQIEEIKEILQISKLPGEEDGDYRTLASFMLTQFNKVPKVGDAFLAKGYIFKVVKMDKFRIDRVTIRRKNS